MAANEFQAAADAWGKLKIGLSIPQITDQESANFYLVYRTNTEFDEGVLA